LYFLQPTCRECDNHHDWTYELPCHNCGKRVDYTDEKCPHCEETLPIWRALEVEALTTEEVISVWKKSVHSPLKDGYRVHLGSIHGQWADYRRATPEGGDFHIRAYPRHYELHYDKISAVDAPARHILHHGPSAAATSSIDIAKRVGETVARTGEMMNSAVRQPYSWITATDEQASEE